MDDRQAAIAAELVKLRDAYGERVQREITELVELATRLIGAPDVLQRLKMLHQRLHKLAGSAGSFGFDGLSRQAHDLEYVVQTWLASDFNTVDEARRKSFVDSVALLSTTRGQSDLTLSTMRPNKGNAENSDSRVAASGS